MIFFTLLGVSIRGPQFLRDAGWSIDGLAGSFSLSLMIRLIELLEITKPEVFSSLLIAQDEKF